MKQLSTKNEFSIPKHRYYELKHFCMQYPDWCKELNDISYVGPANASGVAILEGPKDPTPEIASRIKILKDKIHIVEQAAMRTDEFLAGWIFEGVTKGASFDILDAWHRVPCCREKYYYTYRKFFKVLDDLKQ